jgi:DNA-binding response OmpR family regulator
MLNRPRILIVDDDDSISDLLSLYLIKEQYDTKIAADGETALACFDDFDPSLIILDLMLPGIDGYGVCREIRTKSKVPIIVLSAKGDTFDKVLALEMGADDYVEKPFDTKEIVARVKAALRRAAYSAPAEEPGAVDKVTYPGLSINITEYSVLYNNEPVDMPPKEIELLYFLAKTPNHVFTREQLLDKIWGYAYLGDTRTVDVHIKRIREKINDHEMWKITTIWGIGYKFELKEEPRT